MSFGVGAVRMSKIIMTGGMGLFAFLAALNNVVDPGSNWIFVQHVLSMDSVFPDSTLTGRAITDTNLQIAAYVVIIVAEILTSIAFFAAAIAMIRAFKASKQVFQRAKSLTALGVMIGFALWFVGFMAIGGEWFTMWQAGAWNGQEAAFMFYTAILGVGIYVFLDTDGEPV
jgi:predicted small integral membrane protein